MNWDWYDLDKAADDRKGVSQAYRQKSKQKLAERQALERELQNVTGNRNAIFDIKGRATNEKIRAKIEEEKRLNREAQSKSRKDAIQQGKDKVVAGAKAGAKAVQDTATATARGIGQAGAKYIDRGLGGDKPKATMAQQQARFQQIKRRAEKAKRPIDYKAIEERRRRKFKDGRDPKLYYNERGQPVNPVAQAAKNVGKKTIGLGKKVVAAPFKSAGGVTSQLFRGGKRVSSVHPSIEYDSQGRRNPNYDPKEAERKKREAEAKNPKTGKTSSNTGVLGNKPPAPPPPPQPKSKKLSPNVQDRLKRTTNPDFDV